MIEIMVLWNIMVFVIYVLDKLFAIMNFRRIPEKLLIFFAFLVGGVGAILGMYLFRHKTRKTKFKLFVPVAFIITVVVMSIVFYKK